MPVCSSVKRDVRIHHIKLQQRQAPVTIDDLAQMLEIDLTVFADHSAFRRRLQRALDDAFQQGAQN
jgi:hypothetical protein